jgi:hypothetical protein
MAAHLRQSLPNMKVPPPSSEPPKIYALHLLLTTNYRLPGDVDRNNLEVRFLFFHVKECAGSSAFE